MDTAQKNEWHTITLPHLDFAGYSVDEVMQCCADATGAFPGVQVSSSGITMNDFQWVRNKNVF